MDLKHFLDEHDLSQAEMARTVKISYNYMSEITRKVRSPSPKLALRISEATGGAVTIMDLLYPERR